jgi:F-type H+-transporting ATPase subunit gamma
MKPRRGRRIGLVIFGSDRGLCGGFNSGLIEEAERFAEQRPSRPLGVVSVGKVVNRKAHRAGFAVDRFYRQPPRTGQQALVEDILEWVTAAFTGGGYAEVHLLYARYVSALRQVTTVERLLPAGVPSSLPAPAATVGPGGKPPGGPARSPVFEPSPNAMLALLLPEILKRSVQRALLHSVASENAARQTAMLRATENADAILSDLVRRYRRTRQESITREMLELAGGGLQPAAGGSALAPL